MFLILHLNHSTAFIPMMPLCQKFKYTYTALCALESGKSGGPGTCPPPLTP